MSKYCQTFNTKTFLVETPNCLDILNFCECKFCTFHYVSSPNIKPYFLDFRLISRKIITSYFPLSDLMHFALIFLLFRFVKVLKKSETLRPDVKAYCQTFDTRVFFVGIPNCLDINLNFFGCIFCTFYCEPAKNTTIIFRFSLTFSNNNYEPLGLLTTGCICLNLLNLTNIVKYV